MAADPEAPTAKPLKRRRTTAVDGKELARIGADLGLVFTPEDVFYLMFTGVEAIQSRPALARRAALYASLLDRVIPDTELTRRRVARLLMGLEAVSYALRVLLTIDDVDLLKGAKTALTSALDEVAKSGGRSGETGTNAEFDQIVGRLNELFQKVKNHPDPQVQNALAVLSNLDALLDVTVEFPKLPPLSDLDVKAFKPRTERKKVARR
jgi:hypothetical protein